MEDTSLSGDHYYRKHKMVPTHLCESVATTTCSQLSCFFLLPLGMSCFFVFFLIHYGLYQLIVMNLILGDL